MHVSLMHSTPLWVAVDAGLTCTDNVGKNVDERRFLNSLLTSGHESVLEHIVYTFCIEDISRALLQQLARHRIASLSVQSTRWALKKMIRRMQEEKGEAGFINWKHYFSHMDWGVGIDDTLDEALEKYVETVIKTGWELDHPNDELKYYLPEALRTSAFLTINCRSLRNLIKLRSDPHAMAEFRELSAWFLDVVPADHRFLFRDVYGEEWEWGEV